MTVVGLHFGKFYMDISSSATATTDVSAGVTDFKVKMKQNTGEYFTLASTWAQQTVGGKNWEVEVSAIVDTSITSAHYYLSDWALTQQGARTIELYAPSKSTGSVQLSGECYIDGADDILAPKAGEGKVQMTKFKLKGDSTLTKAVAA